MARLPLTPDERVARDAWNARVFLAPDSRPPLPPAGRPHPLRAQMAARLVDPDVRTLTLRSREGLIGLAIAAAAMPALWLLLAVCVALGGPA